MATTRSPPWTPLARADHDPSAERRSAVRTTDSATVADSETPQARLPRTTLSASTLATSSSLASRRDVDHVQAGASNDASARVHRSAAAPHLRLDTDLPGCHAPTPRRSQPPSDPKIWTIALFESGTDAVALERPSVGPCVVTKMRRKRAGSPCRQAQAPRCLEAGFWCCRSARLAYSLMVIGTMFMSGQHPKAFWRASARSSSWRRTVRSTETAVMSPCDRVSAPGDGNPGTVSCRPG
jgi:hypothetical protein